MSFLPLLLLGQKNYQPVVIDQKIDHPLFQQQIILKPEIESGDPSEEFEMRSNCIVNADSTRLMGEVESFWKGDTLVIQIYETNPAYSQKLLLKIIKGRVSSKYDYISSPVVRRKIKTINQKLVVNTMELKKGSRLKGYIEYRGLCVKNCDDEINLKGYFYTLV